MDGDWRQMNHAMWESKTLTHLRSQVYDVAGFKAGRSTLRPHEIADLGAIAGKAVLHLQCHFGLDTLSLARLGADVTGLDFSGSAIAAARALGAECGIAAHFVESDVYAAPQRLGRQFDLVYTGVGALCWLPDIWRWAAVVSALLRPGGELYLYEFHPLVWIFEADTTARIDYFTPASGYRDGGPVTYADDGASDGRHWPTAQWNHNLGSVVTALCRAGLQVFELRELDRDLLPRWAFMRQDQHGQYAMPADQPNLPFMYVLRARRD